MGTWVVAVCLGLALWLFWQYNTTLEGGVVEITWLYLPGGTTHTLGLGLDFTSITMAVVVTTIGLAVYVFSVWYMHDHPGVRRYFAQLGLFLASMLGLVFSTGPIQFFMSWELVGFCSYLLIGFYTEQPAAARAASQAFWVNRVADAAFLAGIFLLFSHQTVWSVFDLQLNPPPADRLTWAGILLLTGVAGKSAQVPLHGWLPDAMTGPSPVSALMHAATMVAAGVYLLVRFSPLLTPEAQSVVLWVGTTTAVIGSLLALWQWDIKRILAFSTVAQLGYMVAAVGLGQPQLAFFHLMTHAGFKAALFLAAGSVLHSVAHAAGHTRIAHNPQDIRQLGGLARSLPVTATVAALALAALAGVPFTAGFLSKEPILLAGVSAAPVAGWLLVAGAVLTALYGARWWLLIFAGQPRMPLAMVQHIQERNLWQRLPLVGLGLLSLSLGYLPVLHLFLRGHHTMGFTWLPWGLLAVSTLAVAMIYGLWRQGRLLAGGQSTRVFELWVPTVYRAVGVLISRRLAGLLALLDTPLVDGLVRGAGKAVAQFRPLLRDVSLSALSRWLDERVLDRWVGVVAESFTESGKRLQVLQPGYLQRYMLYTVLGMLLIGWLVALWV